MQDNVHNQPDSSTLFELSINMMNSINEIGREAAVALLNHYPAEGQHYLLQNMSEAIRAILIQEDIGEEGIEEVAHLLEAVKIVAEFIGTNWAMALYHYRQGLLEEMKGQPETALYHYERAAADLEDHLYRTDAMHAVARILFQTGNIAKAEYQFQRLIEMAQKHSLAQALGYGYLGLAEVASVKNDIPAAIAYLQQARQCSQDVNDPKLMAQIITQQGIQQARRGALLLAQEYYTQLEAYLQSTNMPEGLLRRARSSLMLNKAALALRECRKKGRRSSGVGLEDQTFSEEMEKLVQEAQRFVEEALKDQSSLFGTEQIENLAMASIIAFVTSNNYEELPQVTQNLLTAFRMAEKMNYARGLLLAGDYLATIYSLRGYFEPAHRVYAITLDALERLRNQAGDEVDRLRYFEDKTDIYNEIVLLCLFLTELRRLSVYQCQALFYTEHAKSRTFIESLGRTANIIPPSNLPVELLHKEGQVLDQLRALEIAMRSLLDRVKQEQVQRAYSEAQIELDEIWKQIGDIAPEYAALRRGQPITFEVARQLLRV